MVEGGAELPEMISSVFLWLSFNAVEFETPPEITKDGYEYCNILQREAHAQPTGERTLLRRK
ncbi:hypothetical protein GN244_ATG20127 [Phytophthora infestans]|uniref:Uncharacterized protein n=1 Tax=Phytophthora infestans TaxID=4787 RepID=A0A833SHK2_PHYIN|nr:hypothetical protein GN244_ATG20127 [Phytophthora infestans]